MIDYHRIPPDRFAGLASGLGGPATVADLAGGRLSKNLLLLRYVAEAWSVEDGGCAADILIEADRRRPEVTAELMGDPLVGAWLAATARRLRAFDGSEIPVEDDLAQLGALAAAAAVKVGLDVETRTRTRLGGVTLPTVGTARLDVDGAAVVTVSGGQITVTTESASMVAGEDERWRPLRRLTGDAGAEATLEDDNPYRGLFHARPAARLSAGEARRWQALFGEASALLATHAPERAAELAAGLRSVVPLVDEDDGVARSGTARDAFGAVGQTFPRSSAEFAVTLVHEFQHSKLSALLDLTALHTPDGTELHFAPWRADPRPTAGLIQGVYAFLGVADTWRALLSAPGLATVAAKELAFARQQVDVGLSALEKSAELTPEGLGFAAGLRGSLNRILAEPLPAEAETAAEQALAQRRHTFEQHQQVQVL